MRSKLVDKCNKMELNILQAAVHSHITQIEELDRRKQPSLLQNGLTSTQSSRCGLMLSFVLGDDTQ
jgi:hypothetical protein